MGYQEGEFDAIPFWECSLGIWIFLFGHFDFFLQLSSLVSSAFFSLENGFRL